MKKILFQWVESKTSWLLLVTCLPFLCNCSDSPQLLEDAEVEDSIHIQPPVTEAKLDSVEFHCQRDNLKIYGKLYKKVAEGQCAPAVILSHSSSLTHEAMKSYARKLAERGMVTYCFDFCGGSSKSKSDGSTDSMTVFTEVEDLKAVVKSIRNLEEVYSDSIYLLGSSQGGLVSALAAEELDRQVCGMILFYPAFNIPDMVKQFSSWMGTGGNIGNLGGMMGENFVNTIKDFDVWSHIGNYSGPVTILHGSNDIIVPVSYSQKAVELYKNASLHIIEGANHGFNAANLGGFSGIMGGTTDFDAEVMPWVYAAVGRP